jgi:hypothetical protein
MFSLGQILTLRLLIIFTIVFWNSLFDSSFPTQVIGFLVVELAFHSALRFMLLELFLVKVLIPCAPVVGVLCFFPLLVLPQCSSERGMLDMLPLPRLLL